MSAPLYGLLGEKLGHSYSPFIHELLGMPGYQLFQLTADEIEPFLKRNDIAGLNVTIPYKQTVLPFCHSLSDIAQRLGNVNTLTFDAAGHIHGDNTDYQGFLYMLQRAGISLSGKKVLILGRGGAAKTAALAAADLAAGEIVMVSRSGGEKLEKHSDAAVLINATPLGMYPNNHQQAVDLQLFPALQAVVDLVYNPLRTQLVLAAKKANIPAIGGLSMLAEQARAAAQIFQERSIGKEETSRIYSSLLQEIENIVLIGMPGCGKSSIGKALAARMKRVFVDTDEMIWRQSGRSAEQIINNEGEAAFRAIEAEVLQDCLKHSKLVIASGGGAVLSSENRLAMRQNSRVYWLERPLSLLAQEGRPLSRDLPAMYHKRKVAYQEAADVVIDNSRAMSAAMDAIGEEFYAYTDS